MTKRFKSRHWCKDKKSEECGLSVKWDRFKRTFRCSRCLSTYTTKELIDADCYRKK